MILTTGVRAIARHISVPLIFLWRSELAGTRMELVSNGSKHGHGQGWGYYQMMYAPSISAYSSFGGGLVQSTFLSPHANKNSGRRQ